MNKIILILLVFASAISIAHYGYVEPVVVELNQSIVLDVGSVISLENATLIQSNNTLNESVTAPPNTTQTRIPMDVDVFADCQGIHVLAAVDSDPLAGADVTVYIDPKDPLILLSIGQTDENGEFDFNSTAQKIGIIVSKTGYKYFEGLFSVPSIDCSNRVNETKPENTIIEANGNGSKNETVTTENETINETENATLQTQSNETVGTYPVKEQDNGLADLLLPVLVIAAAAIAYYVFRGDRISVNPMPPPKGKADKISVNPMPPPKEGNVSVNPMPPPKAKK